MSDKLRKALENAISVIESVRESGAVDADDLLWLDRECAAAANAGYIALAARPDSPTLDERARVERDARLRDARDALDMAALWLHRTFDLPARDSQQAESWERKARSGRVALAATPAPTLDVERLRRVILTTDIIGPDGIPPHRWDLQADTTARIIAREYDRLADTILPGGPE